MSKKLFSSLQKTRKWISIFFYILLISFSFSCAKDPKTSRIKKTESINMNPGVTAQSEQLAASQNINFGIASISRPKSIENTNRIDVEVDIKDPGQQYIPVTTHHENGQLETAGTYTDSARGVQVNIQARCSTNDCDKYSLLVSVLKNNNIVYQQAAVSFRYDCRYYSVSIAQGVSGFFRNLDELDSKTQNFTAKNDCQNE